MQIIRQGRVYRAKNPRVLPNGLINDRVVVTVNLRDSDIQFDGPAVVRGKRKHYPRCRLDAFKAWAGEDVTDELKGHWARGDGVPAPTVTRDETTQIVEERTFTIKDIAQEILKANVQEVVRRELRPGGLLHTPQIVNRSGPA